MKEATVLAHSSTFNVTLSNRAKNAQQILATFCTNYFILRVLMEKIIAHCGITCSDCPTFIATKTNNDAERKRVAELWTKQYGHPFKPEDINCDGCQTKGTRVFNYTKICEIRKCGQEKNVENCAYCDEYKCEKISKLHEQASKPKETLDQIRKSLGKDTKH